MVAAGSGDRPRTGRAHNRASAPDDAPRGAAGREGRRGALPTPPRLRGWVHTVMAPLVLLAGVGLMIATPTWGNRFAVAVWMLTGIILFGNSAVYHRVPWSAKVKEVLRRIDHANIAVFIAGTYTPLAVALVTGASRVVLLSIIWACALLGVAFRFLWNGVPRWASTLLYVVMGWTALWWLPQFWRSGGPAIVVLILVGGVFYTVGAVSYARQRPNPSPAWFGFHEVFHTCTAIAAACHAVAIGLAVV